MSEINRFNDMKARCKRARKEYRQRKHKGMIDETFTEINLTGFLSDNPNLIADLKRKYNII